MDKLEHASIARLIAELASSDAERAENAQYWLQGRGIEVIPQLLAAMPTLPAFRQLCAIDVIEYFDVDELWQLYAPSVVETLTPLLVSENEVVQSWSASTLGWLGDPDAIPALEQAQVTLKEAHVFPDVMRRDAIRNTLTRLGARMVILPAQAEQKRLSDGWLSYAWSIVDFDLVMRSLASVQQVILYFQIWENTSGHYHWQGGWSNEHDLTLPWLDLVDRSMHDALVAGHTFAKNNELVISIEWIDRSDL